MADVAKGRLSPILAALVSSWLIRFFAIVHKRNLELSQLVLEALGAMGSWLRQVIGEVVWRTFKAVLCVAGMVVVVVQVGLICVSTMLLGEKVEVLSCQSPARSGQAFAFLFLQTRSCRSGFLLIFQFPCSVETQPRYLRDWQADGTFLYVDDYFCVDRYLGWSGLHRNKSDSVLLFSANLWACKSFTISVRLHLLHFKY